MEPEYKVKIFLSIVYKILSIIYNKIQKKETKIPDPKNILHDINNQMVFLAMKSGGKKHPDRSLVFKIIANLIVYSAAMGWHEGEGNGSS